MRLLVAITACVALLLPVSVRGWGMDVHRLITRRAIEQLPTELVPFFASQRDFVVEHSADPDLWRVVDLRGALGPEDPNHFLDIDAFGDPPPFAGVPRDWDAYVQKYGAEKANQAGRLPWRMEEIYKKLVTAFRDAGRGSPAYAADNARYLSAVLAHYVEDANQPFHAVANYDGQLSGQRGIHSRFETEVILRNVNTLVWGRAALAPIPDMKAYAFDTLIASQALVDGILAADKQATAGREFYDDEYFKQFFVAVRPTLEKRLTDATSGVASAIAAAWTEAGRPVLPADRPRTPARIIR